MFKKIFLYFLAIIFSFCFCSDIDCSECLPYFIKIPGDDKYIACFNSDTIPWTPGKPHLRGLNRLRCTELDRILINRPYVDKEVGTQYITLADIMLRKGFITQRTFDELSGKPIATELLKYFFLVKAGADFAKTKDIISGLTALNKTHQLGIKEEFFKEDCANRQNLICTLHELIKVPQISQTDEWKYCTDAYTAFFKDNFGLAEISCDHNLLHTEFILAFYLLAKKENPEGESFSSTAIISGQNTRFIISNAIPKGLSFLSEFDMCSECEKLWTFITSMMGSETSIKPLPDTLSTTVRESPTTLIKRLAERQKNRVAGLPEDGPSSSSSEDVKSLSDPSQSDLRRGLPPHKVLVGGLGLYDPMHRYNGNLQGTSRDPETIGKGKDGGVLELLFFYGITFEFGT